MTDFIHQFTDHKKSILGLVFRRGTTQLYSCSVDKTVKGELNNIDLKFDYSLKCLIWRQKATLKRYSAIRTRFRQSMRTLGKDVSRLVAATIHLECSKYRKRLSFCTSKSSFFTFHCTKTYEHCVSFLLVQNTYLYRPKW